MIGGLLPWLLAGLGGVAIGTGAATGVGNWLDTSAGSDILEGVKHNIPENMQSWINRNIPDSWLPENADVESQAKDILTNPKLKSMLTGTVGLNVGLGGGLALKKLLRSIL